MAIKIACTVIQNLPLNSRESRTFFIENVDLNS